MHGGEFGHRGKPKKRGGVKDKLSQLSFRGTARARSSAAQRGAARRSAAQLAVFTPPPPTLEANAMINFSQNAARGGAAFGGAVPSGFEG